MSENLDLFAERKKRASRADQIFAAFKVFHADNPRVWTLFVRFTMEAIASGKRNFSADAVCHRIRWETDVQTGGDEVKINNNFTAYYGRMFEAAYPEHADFFRARVRKSTEEPASENDRQVFNDGPPGDEGDLMDELAAMSSWRGGV